MADVKSTPPDHPEKVGLPLVTFLYTLDQVAAMLSMSVDTLVQGYVYLYMRTPGLKTPNEMIARNIAPEDKAPDWRIAQAEFVRWLRHKGFVVRPTGQVVR